MNEAMQTRTLQFRSYNPEARKATFVAATETGVESWDGKEYLLMDGLDLTRYEANPQVLDTHRRGSIREIVGRGTIRQSKTEIEIDVEFTDDTEIGQLAARLAEKGFLRATSVGFLPRKRRTLADDETYDLNGKEIQGPGVIIEKWELYEVSVVPVGADPNALQRDVGDNKSVNDLLYVMRKFFEGHDMGTEGKTAEEIKKEDDERKAAEEVARKLAESQTAENDPKVSTRKADIYEITPRGLEAVADKCIAESKTLEETREILLEASTERSKPVGTIEPKQPEKKEKKQEVGDDVLKRSIIGV